MSRSIKAFISACNICQKSKPRRHAPVGLLCPIPIPTCPFEVVTMDFIPDLPNSNGFDNILVIVDKLTKYGIFIFCSTKITEEDTAKLFFKHIITQYGLPQQIITDHNSMWHNDFWGEICWLMGTKRSLTTAYHPQADGQTEILNQTLEIALCTYIGPSRDDWEQHLDVTYNSSPHTATRFSPAYPLCGFTSKGDDFRNCIKSFIFWAPEHPLWVHHSYIGPIKYYFYIYLGCYTNYGLCVIMDLWVMVCKSPPTNLVDPEAWVKGLSSVLVEYLLCTYLEI